MFIMHKYRISILSGTLHAIISLVSISFFFFFSIFFFLPAMLYGMWDLSSLTGDQTHTPFSGGT